MLIFNFLRRLRPPLITIIVIYALSILGYTLIPGVDADGNPYRMDFFHAFYFVSFMGSTIGFGEIPYEFTGPQRMWTVVTMYATVIGWLYSIGTVLAIFRDPAFSRAVMRNGFAHQVSRLRDPFFLVCGYGYTGSEVVRRLMARGFNVVVVELSPERHEALELDNLPFDVPHMCGTADDPEVLHDAGIDHPQCIGVIAITDSESVNLSVAIASKLLVPDRTVISRAESQDYIGNLASFGTDHIIDPFETYAEYLAIAIRAPYHHLVYDWLISPRHRQVSSARGSRDGLWIICGYGRFGRALRRWFDLMDLAAVYIEPDAEQALKDGIVVIPGLGTEAATLREANVRHAVGIIAGSPNDANNLSIIMTARELNPSLVTVARQNSRSNRRVFEAANIDMVMDPSLIISNRIMAVIKTPLLIEFIERQKQEESIWARKLLRELSDIVGDRELDSWSLRLSAEETPAVYEAIVSGESISVGLLYTHPRDASKQLPCVPLLLKRGREVQLLPNDKFQLYAGDELLFAGRAKAQSQMMWTMNNADVLHYVVHGEELSGYLWQRAKSLMSGSAQ